MFGDSGAPKRPKFGVSGDIKPPKFGNRNFFFPLPHYYLEDFWGGILGVLVGFGGVHPNWDFFGEVLGGPGIFLGGSPCSDPSQNCS